MRDKVFELGIVLVAAVSGTRDAIEDICVVTSLVYGEGTPVVKGATWGAVSALEDGSRHAGVMIAHIW